MTLHQSGRTRFAVPGTTGALLLLALAAASADAQVYASEHALAQQTANGTIITVEYHRPVARGRALFGTVVKWGHEWTPGANWATTIDVDHDVTLDGKPLPKGKYSVWTVPWPDAWTVILSRKARAFHTMAPPASDEQLRLTVKPVQAPHVEMLTWSFPVVTKEGAELHMQWGTMDVPLHLGVGAPGAVMAMSADERAKYVGVYRMTHGGRRRVATSTFTVFDSAGVLRLRRSVAPDGFYDAQFDLVKSGEHTFQPIAYRHGVLVGLEPAITIAFSFDGGRAREVELRAVGGMIVSARGLRDADGAVAPLGDSSFAGPTIDDLSGAWASGSTDEPTVRHFVLRPQCNYGPGFWALDQRGDTVRAYTVKPSQAQGIATRELPSSTPREGRVRGGVVAIGDARTGYRLRFDSASGHLRGTFNGAPFWAVPMQIIRPAGCIPVP